MTTTSELPAHTAKADERAEHHQSNELRKKLMKILVRLRIDSDDYPPVSYESLWATLNPDDTCTIDNTPYYVYGLSKGDSVSVKFEDGERYADTITSKGGHSTLRVFSSNQDESMEIIDFIRKNGGTVQNLMGYHYFRSTSPQSALLK